MSYFPKTIEMGNAVNTDTNTVRTSTFSDTSAEETLYTLKIPASNLIGGGLAVDDLVECFGIATVVSWISGSLTARLRVGGNIISSAIFVVGGGTKINTTPIIFMVRSLGSSGEMVPDREPDFTVDTDSDIDVTFTIQASVAHPSNSFRGESASVLIRRE